MCVFFVYLNQVNFSTFCLCGIFMSLKPSYDWRAPVVVKPVHPGANVSSSSSEAKCWTTCSCLYTNKSTV